MCIFFYYFNGLKTLGGDRGGFEILVEITPCFEKAIQSSYSAVQSGVRFQPLGVRSKIAPVTRPG